jgi:hypothetical protein
MFRRFGLLAHSDPPNGFGNTDPGLFFGRKLLPQVEHEFNNLDVVQTVLESGHVAEVA